jgi:hypothetical protein
MAKLFKNLSFLFVFSGLSSANATTIILDNIFDNVKFSMGKFTIQDRRFSVLKIRWESNVVGIGCGGYAVFDLDYRDIVNEAPIDKIPIDGLPKKFRDNYIMFIEPLAQCGALFSEQFDTHSKLVENYDLLPPESKSIFSREELKPIVEVLAPFVPKYQENKRYLAKKIGTPEFVLDFELNELTYAELQTEIQNRFGNLASILFMYSVRSLVADHFKYLLEWISNTDLQSR